MLFEKTGDVRSGISIKILAGISQYYLGNYEHAFSLFFDIIDNYTKLRKPKITDQEHLATAYYYLSILFMNDTDQEKRIKYLYKAKAIYTQTESKEGLATCYNQLARIYFSNKEHKKALTTYNQFLQMSGENGDKVLASIALNNLGVCWAHLGNYNNAKTFIHAGLKIKKSLPDKRSYIVSMISLAEVHILEKNYSEAISVLESIKNQAINLGLKGEQRSIAQHLADVYEKQGEYALALENHKLLYKLHEELLNIERERYNIEADIKFESERQKREALYYKRRMRQANMYNKKLEASNSELRMFAHLAAHDLKEPLRTITLNMELLEKITLKKLQSDEKELFGCISKASKHMFHIVDDIQTLVSLDKSDLEIEVVNINEIIHDIRKEYQDIIDEKNVSIHIDTFPAIKADASQMFLLFKNLISNAIKYNDKENPIIYITCNSLPDKYRFIVQDNGIGIKRKDHKNIFNLFDRGSNIHSKFDGTGIGLSLCKRIIERHTGTIRVASRPNEGSVFIFYIPKL